MSFIYSELYFKRVILKIMKSILFSVAAALIGINHIIYIFVHKSFA